MENKLWIVLIVMSAMTSLTSQGVLDFSSLMGVKEKPTTTTPAPQQEFNNYNPQQQQYGQQHNQYNQQAQKPNKGFKPQKSGFGFGFGKEELKQELKLDKFDLKLDKLEKKPDKSKPDKMQNNYPNQATNYSNSHYNNFAVENPIYSTYVPQLSPPIPMFDDGSYMAPPQPYGPQYGGGQFRGQQHRGPTYGNTNNLTAYNIYRQMYGYDRSVSQAPNYGPPPPAASVYSSPPVQNYGNGPPSNSYNEPTPQYGPPPAYGAPPPSYQAPGYGTNRQQGPGNGPVYGVGQGYDQGYHEEPFYHEQPNYGVPYSSPQVDYSKYISPVPYSELSEYISPAQYNDYTGNLYQAYNIPAPTARPYTTNYTSSNYNNEFRMVVAVVVLNGGLGYPQSNVQGTLFISEIYPYVCLISGVVTGLPPSYKYGIGIHNFGDLTSGCTSIGGHFNPAHKNHGNINYIQSHAGDLGNLMSDASGIAYVNKISRNQFSIYGRNAVAGRTIGICEKQDDLGQGGNVQSLRDGNCGTIQACGIIGLSNTGSPNANSGHY